MDLLKYGGIDTKQDEFEITESFSEDEFEVETQDLQLHRIISTTFCTSVVKNSSKTNLLTALSVSASSVLESSLFIPQSEESFKKEALLEEITKAFLPFDFTREELQKRLQNIVKMSLKNLNDDPEVITYRR